MSTHRSQTLSGLRPSNVPRTRAIGEAWRALGPEVLALSNASGFPLARTIKLILDPLVIRPRSRPALASGSLTSDDAAELQACIRDAKSDLVATASWYRELKLARRRLRITEGNPQELYFQRCFELARAHGAPDTFTQAAMEALAAEVVTEMKRPEDTLTSERLQAFARDPAHAAALASKLDAAWTGAAPPTLKRPTAAATQQTRDALCGSRSAFAELVESHAGSASGAALFISGVALALGLTDHETPQKPAVGESATKRDLSKPFDRSIVERLFAALAALVEVESADALPRIYDDEVRRATSAWQLAEESSRVMMLLGTDASTALVTDTGRAPGVEADLADGSNDSRDSAQAEIPQADTPVHMRLRARWHREAYVRRVRRLPESAPPGTIADVADIRGAYVRRLWARMHGRELRHTSIGAEELEDTLEGVLRSVVLDQRHRLKRAIERDLSEVA